MTLCLACARQLKDELADVRQKALQFALEAMKAERENSSISAEDIIRREIKHDVYDTDFGPLHNPNICRGCKV